MRSKKILTESEKRQIIDEKQRLIIESFRNEFNKIKRIDEAELKEDSYVDSEGRLHSDIDTEGIGEFFNEESKHFGFMMVFKVLTERFYDKILKGEIPETREFSSDEIDEYANVVRGLMSDDNSIPTGVGAELLKRALVYYLEDLKIPSDRTPIVGIEAQFEFINDLISKL